MPVPTPEQWRALGPYLDEAIEKTDAERSAWLSALRTRNPAIADQLEVCLDQHRALSEAGFLEGRSAELSWEAGLAGQTLGAYRLISQIGEGGSSSVWLAERNDARFERRVAVKFLKIARMGRAGEQRFRREGLILGKLAHPHIAELFDAGVSHAGQPYLILEHIDGDHIERYCDRHKLTIEARIALFLDALDAVAYAHDHQVIHRDLKPPNILVRRDGQVKLLDFSIAKLIEDEAALAAESTQMLTPEYAAPEQISGGATTPATDVYALGVVLYILLTGQHPSGAGPQTQAGLMHSILDSEPVRPSDVVSFEATGGHNAAMRATTPPQLGRTLRGDLDTIVLKALKKKSGERYSSVRALAADLRSYLRHEPIQAKPDSLAYRSGKFLRRHRWKATATAFASLATAGAALAAWTFAHRSEPSPELKQQRLTANAASLPVLDAAISPDGKYLGFTDREGIHLQTVETGEIRDVMLLPEMPRISAQWAFGSWYPDSLRFVASVSIAGKPETVWSVPVSGQSPEKLAEVDALTGVASVSPDGSHIAFAAQHSAVGAAELWVMGPRGESPHRILTAENGSGFWGITWSPAGNRLAYMHLRPDSRRSEALSVTIQTCDLSGANQTTVVREDTISAFAWVPPNRLIYSRSTQRGSARTGDLWELTVDGRDGTPQGAPSRRTDWSGFSIKRMNATADGKRLAFVRRAHHSSIFVGELADNGNRVLHSRRLLDDDHINIALAWTPDSREVIFSSQHAATRQIFRQALRPGSIPQQLTSSPVTSYYVARLTPDGRSVLLEGEPSRLGPMGIYRAAVTGGVPQLLFPVDGLTQFWCSNKAVGLCVTGGIADGRNELVISSFDPGKAGPKEVLHIPVEPRTDARVGWDYSWELSPDGAWIAMLKRYTNRIRLIPLSGGPEKSVTVAGYPELMNLDWSVDSQSFYVSTYGPAGGTMLHIDLLGTAQSIWTQPDAVYLSGFPSPDARHLAITSESADANVWMFGNF